MIVICIEGCHGKYLQHSTTTLLHFNSSAFWLFDFRPAHVNSHLSTFAELKLHPTQKTAHCQSIRTMNAKSTLAVTGQTYNKNTLEKKCISISQKLQEFSASFILFFIFKTFKSPKHSVWTPSYSFFSLPPLSLLLLLLSR